jgi:hypothetical protein
MRHNRKPFEKNPACMSATAISELSFIPDWFGASPVSFRGHPMGTGKNRNKIVDIKECERMIKTVV